MTIQGKVIVITGAGSGIGRETALKFAGEGVSVVVAERDERSGMETVDLITEKGGQATFVCTDVTMYSDVERAVDAAVETYGRLDFMFNNAGIGKNMPFLDVTPEIFDSVMKVNQYGVFYGIYAAAQKMKQLGIEGVIVNCASIMAFLASPGAFCYHASKAAVKMMTQSAAFELAPYGIRVVGIAPGYVDTPLNKARNLDQIAFSAHMRKKPLQQKNIADVVFFLCSDEAHAINGSTVMADDGYVQFK